MKCQKCDEKATVHFTQLEGGEMNKVSLCESCAAEEGIMDISGFGLAESVLSPEAISPPVGESSDSCSSCGFTRSKFQQTGRLGCSQCYITFSDEILSRLGPMHRGLRHFGKHPEGFEGEAFSARRLNECKERLEKAVDTENYEEAARIRDEIRQLTENAQKASEQSEPSSS